MRIVILFSFMLIFCLFYRDASTKETVMPLSGIIYPFKDKTADLSLLPATAETISPLPIVPQVTEKKAVVIAPKKPWIQKSAAPVKEEVQETVTSEKSEEVSSQTSEIKETKPVVSETVKEEPADPVNRPYELKQYIKKSANTYFFTDLQSDQHDVSVSLVSITPYGAQDILQYEILNAQNGFFFISNISIRKDDKVILAELYNDPLIRPGDKITGLAVVPKMNKTLGTLTVLESGGRARIFNLKFYVQ